ncbi:hypothetical protein BGZ46_010847 [Entomortierella lignicola]|nr:hypothetical protein BGZ46_010847 [Entomortierella lignicola]
MSKRSSSDPHPGYGLDYFLNNRINFTPKGYTYFRLSENPKIRSKTIVHEWQSWISHLAKSSDVAVRGAVSSTTAISLDLITRWKEEHNLSDDNDELESSFCAEFEEVECPSSVMSAKRVKSISSRSSSSRHSSSSRSSSTLSPEAISLMKVNFKSAFDEFKGDAWMTPTGTNVDNTLLTYIMEMENESSFHSFIIDRMDSVLPLFTQEDQLYIQNTINGGDSIFDQFELQDSKVQELVRYQVHPDTLSDLLSDGWKKLSCEREGMTARELWELHETFQRPLYLLLSVYRLHIDISRDKSENWHKYYIWGFLGLFFSLGKALLYEPGEISSTASTTRKNHGRALNGKSKVQGRKADGIVLCRNTKLEICTFEFGCIDNELTGTKELTDLRKLAKSMKDMFDAIIKKCKDPINARKELRTFGVLTSGLRIYIFSLCHLDGRFFALKNEADLTIPSVWDRLENTETIVSLLCKLLIFKDCLSSTCEKIIQWTKTGGIQEMKRLSCSKVEKSQYFVATMPSP